MNESLLEENIRMILIREDPMGIYSHENKNVDEYDNEIKDIIRLMPSLIEEDEFVNTFHQVFKKRFGDFEVGYRKKFEKIGHEIWELIKWLN